MFLLALTSNIISIIIAYLIIQYLFYKNIEMHDFIYYFNVHGLLCFSILLFYIASFFENDVIIIKIIINLLFILFYLKVFDTAKIKYNERFRSMILSFGFNRKTYFISFLSKRFVKPITEAFFFGTGIYYFFDNIFKSKNDLSIINVILPALLFFLAASVKILRKETFTEN